MHVHHVNLQSIVGGGEIYTRSLTRALIECGVRVTLYVHPANEVWNNLGVKTIRIENEEQLAECLPARDACLLVHTKLSEETAMQQSKKHFLAGYAHLPMHQREPGWLSHCQLVLTVSRYCLGLLERAGVKNVYPEPMYGVADPARGDPDAPIVKRSPYNWDGRKLRDVLLGKLEPLAGLFSSRETFLKKPGLTLGIVSLIAPIKQFPLLFSHLAPILARHDVNLEVFGAGGYAQVRDLKAALAPIRHRTRFWGFQQDVAAVYPKLDYLLTGLPEKEALGLNVLESQICGTPVLAPRAPPFTETVLDGRSGFLYRDPREDRGADFEKLLSSLGKRARPDPRQASDHLAEFSYAALVGRTKRLLERLRNRMPA